MQRWVEGAPALIFWPHGTLYVYGNGIHLFHWSYQIFYLIIVISKKQKQTNKKGGGRGDLEVVTFDKFI